jgi:hypothetical protein
LMGNVQIGDAEASLRSSAGTNGLLQIIHSSSGTDALPVILSGIFWSYSVGVLIMFSGHVLSRSRRSLFGSAKCPSPPQILGSSRQVHLCDFTIITCLSNRK